MSTIILDGIDNRTNSDTIKLFCQNFGRILNCYIKSNQCIVTFAEEHHAEEFVRTSPHRIDSNGTVHATWKTNLNRTNSQQQRTTSNIIDNCCLIIRGTAEQLDEKSLLKYFLPYGHIRMCLPNLSEGYATITFDDRTSCERILKESRHFLNGRSLIIEPYRSIKSESSKRMKYSDPNELSLTTRFEQEKEQLINEQVRLRNQYEQCMQLYEYEKKQLNDYLTKQQTEFTQQITHYQYLLKQSLEEITSKDKQIEQLKQENKDIDDLLRQTVHDNEQQQINSRKREEVHNQMKRKYEDLYKAYMKLKDNCTTQRDKDSITINNPVTSILNKSKSTIDNVRKKL